MTKAMSEFTTDLQHSGMPAKDLDETIEFYTKKLGFELAGLFHNGENPLRIPALRPSDHRNVGGGSGSVDHRCHQPLGIRHSRHRSRIRQREETRTEFQR